MTSSNETNELPVAQRPCPPWIATWGLFLARLSVTAWVGAATLFVVVGVMEVTRGGFDSATKDRLVAVRFPAFYLFGFTLITLGWIGTWLSQHLPDLSKNRRRLVLVALAFAMGLMIIDYLTVYRELLSMVQPPGAAKPAHFIRYHEGSKWINLAGLLFCVFSVGLLSWPSRQKSNVD